jgi:hypothetical protein
MQPSRYVSHSDYHPKSDLVQKGDEYIDSETGDRYREELVDHFDGFRLLNPIVKMVKIRKTFEDRITEYLDKCGVLNENMRRDIIAMIKEEETE